MDSLQAFIEISNRCTTREQLAEVFKNTLRNFGVDGFMYSLVRDSFPKSQRIHHGLVHSYPQAWVKHYLENNYIENDPTYRRIIQSSGAFTWKDLPRILPYSKKDSHVMHEAEEAGLKNGISLSIHGPYGKVLGFGFISHTAHEDISRDDLSVLYAMANQFNLVFTSFEAKPVGGPPVSLTWVRGHETHAWNP